MSMMHSLDKAVGLEGGVTTYIFPCGKKKLKTFFFRFLQAPTRVELQGVSSQLALGEDPTKKSLQNTCETQNRRPEYL